MAPTGLRGLAKETDNKQQEDQGSCFREQSFQAKVQVQGQGQAWSQERAMAACFRYEIIADAV